MKVIKYLFMLAIIVTYLSCIKITSVPPQTNCFKYPENKSKVCGNSHDLLKGKMWNLDSVFVNNVNVTDSALNLVEGSYGFWISESLEDDWNYFSAFSIVFKGPAKSYAFEYHTSKSKLVDSNFTLRCGSGALFPDSNRAPVYGMYYPIKRAIDWKILKFEDSVFKIQFIDTLYSVCKKTP